MCVCVCVYIYIYIYLFIYLFIYLIFYVSVYIFVCLFIYVSLFMYLWSSKGFMSVLAFQCANAISEPIGGKHKTSREHLKVGRGPFG